MRSEKDGIGLLAKLELIIMMIINITIPTANIVERIEHNQASKGSNEIKPPIIKITPKHPVIEFSLF